MCKTANKSVIFSGLFFLISVSGLMSPHAFGQEKLEWQPFEKALAIADTTNRPLFVDVWAPWCGWCRKMKRDVYPELEQELSSFVLTRLNYDDMDSMYRYDGRTVNSRALAKKLKVQSVPAIVILSWQGDFLMGLNGFIQVEPLRRLLQKIAENS